MFQATTAFIGSAQDKRDSYTSNANSAIENAEASSLALGAPGIVEAPDPFNDLNAFATSDLVYSFGLNVLTNDDAQITGPNGSDLSSVVGVNGANVGGLNGWQLMIIAADECPGYCGASNAESGSEWLAAGGNEFLPNNNSPLLITLNAEFIGSVFGFEGDFETLMAYMDATYGLKEIPEDTQFQLKSPDGSYSEVFTINPGGWGGIRVSSYYPSWY